MSICASSGSRRPPKGCTSAIHILVCDMILHAGAWRIDGVRVSDAEAAGV